MDNSGTKADSLKPDTLQLHHLTESSSLVDTPTSSAERRLIMSSDFSERRKSFVNSTEPEKESPILESSRNNSTWINAIVSGVIALFYTGLIIVSVLVCLYSIKSLYITSNIPVTSTTIEEQDEDFEPPVLLLMFATDRVAEMCHCQYNFFTADLTNSCEMHVLRSNAERYLKVIDPETHQLMIGLIQDGLYDMSLFVETSFLYFQGPSNWHKLEVLKVDCDLEQNLNGTTNLTFESKPIVEYLFLPSWKEFMSLPEQERDLAVYRHLREHPGMRFFPYGFENFALISRTEIWGVESTSPAVRLQTEISLSLIDREGFIGAKNSSRFVVEVQWKDGLVTQVKSVITATKWSSVSVVCTMLLMLEKAYGYGTRIYASIKSEREKKKIQKQMRQQRELAENTYLAEKSANGSPQSPRMKKDFTGFSSSPCKNYLNGNLKPKNSDNNDHLNDEILILSNGYASKDGAYNKLPTYDTKIDETDNKFDNLPRNGSVRKMQNEGDGKNVRNRKPKAEITPLNLSRLRRNMVEISAILTDSGISLEDHQNLKL